MLNFDYHWMDWIKGLQSHVGTASQIQENKGRLTARKQLEEALLAPINIIKL